MNKVYEKITVMLAEANIILNEIGDTPEGRDRIDMLVKQRVDAIDNSRNLLSTLMQHPRLQLSRYNPGGRRDAYALAGGKQSGRLATAALAQAHNVNAYIRGREESGDRGPGTKFWANRNALNKYRAAKSGPQYVGPHTAHEYIAKPNLQTAEYGPVEDPKTGIPSLNPYVPRKDTAEWEKYPRQGAIGQGMKKLYSNLRAKQDILNKPHGFN